MCTDSLKQLARHHPNHPEPKKIAEFFGFIKDKDYVDPDPVNHQNWRNEEEMKEAGYADELKILEEFKGTRNDWFLKEQRKRGKKATPKAQKGEGSSSQPKKRQKKVAKTLLIAEPDKDEPVANVEENPDSEKVADEGIGADDGDKDSSSSSEHEVDEVEREKRLKAEIEKEKQLRKIKRQEKEDDAYIPSP
ncbi:hypothetical protein Hdeb2414_s0021g00578581 [Helianthus debilis subsp. tardiflorus]